MNELEFGLETIIGNVLHEVTHEHYSRVVTLADEYKFYATAEENLIERLKVIREHETEEDLKYRSLITYPSNGSLFGQLTRKPDSLISVNGINQVLTLGNESRDNELKESLSNYFGTDGVERYTFEEILPISYIDPNAWLLINFDNFNEQEERAKPYPILLRSNEVINFEIVNGVTKYVLVKKPSIIQYKSGGKTLTKEGNNFYLYLNNISIELIEVKEKSNLKIAKDKPFSIDSIDEQTVIGIKGKSFRVAVHQHNIGKLQATRIGYKKDIVTDNKTLVSFIHPALNNLKELLALSSYRDVMNNKQAFARIFAFAPMCKGEYHEKGSLQCNGGKVWEDSGERSCNSCNGTGVNIPTSEMKGAIYPLPQNPESSLWDLSKLMHIERAPIENLTYFKEAIEDVKNRALEAIYSRKINQSTSGTESYQSRLLDAHEQDKALKPLANKIANTITFQYDIVARITELIDGLTNTYTFPNNLGFVSNIDLIEVVKLSRESNLPNELIIPLLEQQAIQEFSNNYEGLAKFDIAKEHKPFFAESSLDVSLKIDRGLVSKDIQYLYTNFDLIMKKIKSKYSFVEFKSLSFELRERFIQDELESIIEDIEGIISPEFGGVSGNEIVTDIDVEAEAKAKLKGTVGGVQGIIQINQAVADGNMTESSAERLLMEIYGFDTETAQSLIEKVPQNLIDDQGTTEIN